MSEEIFRSQDMGLVAFLNYEGFETQELELDIDPPAASVVVVRWCFHATPLLAAKVDQYLGDEAEVLPRRYNQCFARCKRQLHSRTLA